MENGQLVIKSALLGVRAGEGRGQGRKQRDRGRGHRGRDTGPGLTSHVHSVHCVALSLAVGRLPTVTAVPLQLPYSQVASGVSRKPTPFKVFFCFTADLKISLFHFLSNAQVHELQGKGVGGRGEAPRSPLPLREGSRDQAQAWVRD